MEVVEEHLQLKNIRGINIHSPSKGFIFSKMKANIEMQNEHSHIAITNTESMYYAKKIPEHLNYINSAAFSLCDGIGAVFSARFEGKVIKRFNGPDLFIEACDYGQNYGWKHFFYGGKEGVADILVENLIEKYPQMKVVGTYCPPFRDLNKEEEEEIIKKINDSGADIIWVGLGLLKQERWIAKYKNQINIPWAVGVGAAFDFYAGTVKRAPLFFRRLGMEWLYRLAREPRMFKRNVNSFKFMISAIKNSFIQKLK